MLIDSRGIESGSALACDVCVVGAGAAGITLARALRGGGLDVVVLESGGLELEAATQALYAGTASGPVLPPGNDYLATSRMRVFGGSTGHWFGWCRPLDPLDFEKRPWVADSGWPIDAADLEPYHAAASEILEIPPFDDAADARRDRLLPLRPERVRTRFFHISPPTRFGRRYREELERAPAVRVLLYANALAVETGENPRRATRVEAGTLGGRRFSVAARWFVLAAGGIENARLLLASKGRLPAGLGNERDLVGRYFMEHPQINRAGRVVLTDPSHAHAWYDAAGAVGELPDEVALLFLAEEVQRREGLLQVAVQFTAHAPRAPEPTASIGRAIGELDRLRAGERGPAGEGPLFARVDVRCEQAPDPESRVTLARERDALGMPRAQLDWRVGSREADSIRGALAIVAAELGRGAEGRLQLIVDEEAPWSAAFAASHHLGTTRMADSPARGVVDRDGRLFGVENLFVAGSSVFPTGGVANPTFTIVALALRLAERLRTLAVRG